MKTFATALLMATAQAGWKHSSGVSGAPEGAVIVGPDGVNPALEGGAHGTGSQGPLFIGSVAQAGLGTGVGGGSTVFIDSGVDNNPVDATRFAAAVQGSRLLAGDLWYFLVESYIHPRDVYKMAYHLSNGEWYDGKYFEKWG